MAWLLLVVVTFGGGLRRLHVVGLAADGSTHRCRLLFLRVLLLHLVVVGLRFTLKNTNILDKPEVTLT